MDLSRSVDEAAMRMVCEVDGGPIYLMENLAFETNCRALFSRKRPGATFPYGSGTFMGACKRTMHATASFEGRRRLLEGTFDPRSGDLILSASQYPNDDL